MARAPSLEERLAELNALRDGEPASPAGIDLLRKALRLQNNLVVAKAAELAGEFEIEALGAELIDAFDRFAKGPAKKDAGCRAKTACARALSMLPGLRFEARDPVFVRGVSLVQTEPVFGGSVDTAGELRGVCAYGLAASGDPRAMNLGADLLADPEPAARQGAVAAVGRLGVAAVPLLRFAVRAGEDHPDVLHEVFTAVLELDPDDGFAFVQSFLDDAQRSDTAALVLGGSNRDEALGVLTENLARTLDPSSRSVRITAVAMLRHAASRRFLLELLREGSERDAEQVVRALGYFKHEEGLRDRVVEAAANRGLDRLVAEVFGS